jgi:hypothetical protein
MERQSSPVLGEGPPDERLGADRAGITLGAASHQAVAAFPRLDLSVVGAVAPGPPMAVRSLPAALAAVRWCLTGAVGARDVTATFSWGA